MSTPLETIFYLVIGTGGATFLNMNCTEYLNSDRLLSSFIGKSS